MKRMSVYALLDAYKEKHPDGHFFDDATLKFFGERLSEMRVLSETKIVRDWSGEEHECYILSSLQRKHPLGPKRKYSYFDVKTFEYIPV